jgi:hypothetical protein
MKTIYLLIFLTLAGCSPIRVLVEEGSTAEVHIHTHDAGILGVTQPTAEQVKTGEGDVQFPSLIDGVRKQISNVLAKKPVEPKKQSDIVTLPKTSPPGTEESVAGIPRPNSSWGGGNLWKPISDSRGGVPVVLTAKGIPRGRLSLFGPKEIPVQVEYRGLTNGDRQTYFILDKKAEQLQKNLVVQIGERVWVVEDPTVRYE